MARYIFDWNGQQFEVDAATDQQRDAIFDQIRRENPASPTGPQYDPFASADPALFDTSNAVEPVRIPTGVSDDQYGYVMGQEGREAYNRLRDIAQPQEPQQGWLYRAADAVADRVRAAGNGLTLGAWPHITAAVGATVGQAPLIGDLFGTRGHSYNEILTGENQQADQFREDSPTEAMAWEVAGGIPTAVAPVGAAVRGGTLLGRIGRAMTVGGAEGAVYGYNESDADTLGGRLDDAARTAAMTAGVGGLIPAAGAAARPIVNAVANAPIINGAIRHLNPGLPTAAETQLANALRDAGASPAAIADTMAANPRLSAATVDPSARSVLMGIASEPGAAQRTTTETLVRRAQEADGAATAAFDASMGPTPDVRVLLNDMKATQRTNAQQAFGTALDTIKSVDPVPVLEVLANANISEELARRIEREILNAGGNPNAIHQAQSRLGEMARNMRTSAVGSERSAAEEVEAVRQALVDILDAPSGGAYRAAQQLYADDIAIQEAFNRGFSVLRNPLNDVEARPEYWVEWAANAKPAELEAARLGARAAVDQAINSVRNAARRGEQIMETGFNRARIAALFGEEEAERLSRAMYDAHQEALTMSMATGNSLTAQRLASRNAFGVRSMAGGVSPAVLAGGGTFMSTQNPMLSALVTLGAIGGRRLGQSADRARAQEAATILLARGQEGQDAMARLGRIGAPAGGQNLAIERYLGAIGRSATPVVLQ